MIIEVDDKTGQAKTFKSLSEFTYEHSEELDEQYRKKFVLVPLVDVFKELREVMQGMLPENSAQIVRIYEHVAHVVVNCDDGESYSFDRVGEYPYLKLHEHGWSD